MPVKDELARPQYEKLVDRLESLMRPALRPEYQGYYGQLTLSGDGQAQGRPACRPGGRPASRPFVLDEREVPEEIEWPAGDATAAAIDRAWEKGLRPRLTRLT